MFQATFDHQTAREAVGDFDDIQFLRALFDDIRPKDSSDIEMKNAKFGKHPEHEKIVESKVDAAIESNDRLLVVPSKVTAYFGSLSDGVRIYSTKDGKYLAEKMNQSHISKAGEFWAISSNLEALLDRVEKRLRQSDASIKAARDGKFPKEIKTELENRFGKVFHYDISNAENSKSAYAIHKPSGIKIRLSDHDLPSYYYQPDIDLREYEYDEAAQRLADLLEEVGSATNSNFVGMPSSDMQERGSVTLA